MGCGPVSTEGGSGHFIHFRSTALCDYESRLCPSSYGTNKPMKHFPFHDRYIRTTHDKRGHFPRSNAVLMPGSLLPFTANFRRVASTLPTGSVLILTPSPVLSKQRSALVKVAAFLRSNGHHVRTLPFSQRGL